MFGSRKAPISEASAKRLAGIVGGAAEALYEELTSDGDLRRTRPDYQVWSDGLRMDLIILCAHVVDRAVFTYRGAKARDLAMDAVLPLLGSEDVPRTMAPVFQKIYNERQANYGACIDLASLAHTASAMLIATYDSDRLANPAAMILVTSKIGSVVPVLFEHVKKANLP